MKEGLPVNTGAGRIEYKMNDETKNSDGFFDRHKDKIVRGVAGALAVTSVGAAVEGIIPKDAYAASAVVDKYSGEIPSEKELNNVFAKNGLVLATSETVAKPEKQSELSKINVVFQVGNPYYVTFDLDKYTFAVTKLDASPVVDPKSSRTMVPVGFVGQSMGYEKQWDDKNKIVTFKKGDRTVVHKVGTKIYDIKIVGKANQRIVSDSVSYIDKKTGRTMVGLRSCLNSFGIKDEEIGYDSKSKLIYCNFSKGEQAELAKIPMGGGPNYEAEREALKYIKPDFKDNGDVRRLDNEMKKQGYAVFAISGVTVVLPENVYNDASSKINAYEKAILLSMDVYEAEIVKRVKLDPYTKDSNKTKLIWQQKNGKIYGFEGSNGQNVYKVNGNEKTKVQYDAKTGEFKDGTTIEKMSQEKAVELTCKYYAGLKYCDKKDLPCAIEIGKNNVINVYSTKEINQKEKDCFDKLEGKPEDVRFYWNGNVISFDTVVKKHPLVPDKNISKNRLCIISGGKEFPVEMTDKNFYNIFRTNSGMFGRYLCDQVEFLPGRGICITDGYRILFDCDTRDVKNIKWVELDKYILLCTQERRIKGKLSDLVDGEEPFSLSRGGKFDMLKNFHGLDEKEVQKYIETGSDTGIKTFQVLKDSSGVGIIVGTGGECGLNPAYGNLEDTRTAIQRLVEINPGIIPYLVNQCGLDFIGANNIKHSVFNDVSEKDWWATYYILDSGVGVILLNENFVTQERIEGLVWHPPSKMLPNTKQPPSGVMRILITESEGLKNYRHIIETDKGIELSSKVICKTDDYYRILPKRGIDEADKTAYVNLFEEKHFLGDNQLDSRKFVDIWQYGCLPYGPYREAVLKVYPELEAESEKIDFDFGF